MSAIDREPFPRGALIGAACLVGFALVAAGGGRWARLQTPEAVAATSAAAVSLDVSFVDEPDGSVSLHDHASRRLVAVLRPGEDGFVRSVVRGLAHDRRSRGFDAGPPFRISRWSDGRLEIQDIATGRRIDLGAFGPTNRAAFERLLPGVERAA